MTLEYIPCEGCFFSNQKSEDSCGNCEDYPESDNYIDYNEACEQRSYGDPHLDPDEDGCPITAGICKGCGECEAEFEFYC